MGDRQKQLAKPSNPGTKASGEPSGRPTSDKQLSSRATAIILEDRLAQLVLSPKSTHYQAAGFKSLKWGESVDTANMKLEGLNVESSDEHECLFNEKGKLVGYSRTYRQGHASLVPLIKDMFGTTDDVVEQSFADIYSVGKRRVFTFVFPKTLVVAIFGTRLSPGNVPEEELGLHLFDRADCLHEVKLALHDSLEGFAHARKCFDLLTIDHVPVERLPKLDASCTRGPLDNGGLAQEGLDGIRDKKKKQEYVAYAGKFVDTDAVVFAATVASRKHTHSFDGDLFPGDIVVALFIDNAIGTSEHEVRKRRYGPFLQRAYVEAAMEYFPSPDGTYKRKQANQMLYYEWVSKGGERVIVTTEPSDGQLLRIVKSQGPSL